MANGLQGESPSARPFSGDTTAVDAIAAAIPPLERAPGRDDIDFLAREHPRRQEAQEILAAASAVLGGSLDLRETADAIARAAIPRFADWAVVDAPDENGRLARLAVAHSDPTLLAVAEAITRRWPPDFDEEAATNTVLTSGEPVVLSDFRDEFFAPFARDAEHLAALCAMRVRSCVAVPLEAAGERLGVLTLLAAEGGRRYTADDLPLALELGRRAAITLVNARLFARVRRAHAEAETARDRTERLQRLSAELTRSLTPDAVVDVVVRHLALALGALSAGVFEFSEVDLAFRLLGTTGVDAATRSRFERVPVDTPLPIGEIARTREPVLIEDSAAWLAQRPGIPVTPADGIRAWAALPLRIQEGERTRLLGALTLTLDGAHPFPDEERRFLQAFADLCAQALERARLFEDEARARALAERLQTLIVALAQARTRDGIARVVGREARETMGASVASLALLADDGSAFAVRTLVDVDDGATDAWQAMSNTVAHPYGLVVAERTPHFFHSRTTFDARFPDLAPALSVAAGEAVAVLPLLGGDNRRLGALSFGFDTPRAFPELARHAFRSIAQQCATALERVRLYESERAHAAAVAARLEAETAQAVAEAASRAKDELLAFVSHELRAPLAPARALAQVLARAEGATPELRETAAEIERHIAVEARLVENLLEYERAGRGLLTVRCGRCDLRAVARRALRAAGPALRAKRINIEEPYVADDPFAWADPLRAQQILDNLITNAVKFSPAGAAVVIRTHNPEPGWVEVAVADAGYGIASEDLPRLFTPFTQMGSPQSHLSGLGLGLTLSRHLAELQGGTLTATSDGRGRGTTFTLRLPWANANATQATDAEAGPDDAESLDSSESELDVADTTGSASDDGESNRALRILVIEDDSDTATALRRLLSAHGHVVLLAENLTKAEQIVSSETLDVLVSDLRLVGESGLDAPRRVAHAARQSGRPAPPAVVLSGFARENDIAQTRAAGFAAHLVKPVNERALLQALRGAVAAGQSGHGPT